jgi:hypothetical protein
MQRPARDDSDMGCWRWRFGKIGRAEGMGEQDRPGTGWQGPPLQETRKPPAMDK